MGVDLNDSENEYPVPTVRTDGDTVYVIAASIWVSFIMTVYVCTTKSVADCFYSIVTKFHRTKTE